MSSQRTIDATVPVTSDAPSYFVVREGAPEEVSTTVASMELCKYTSRINIAVRDRWRALSLALDALTSGEVLRREGQRVDYYYEIRDAFREQLGLPPYPCVRYRVRTSEDLVFWIPADLCEPARFPKTRRHGTRTVRRTSKPRPHSRAIPTARRRSRP